MPAARPMPVPRPGAGQMRKPAAAAGLRCWPSATRRYLSPTVAVPSPTTIPTCSFASFSRSRDEVRETIQFLFRQISRGGVEECRHRLLGRATEKSLDHVGQRRAPGLFAGDFRSIDVASSPFLMLDVALLFQNAQQGAHR